MYMQELYINEAYKYGFNRVGCIMCPNSSEKHEYIKKRCFPSEVNLYCEKIISNSKKDLSGLNAKHFLDVGGWKTRLSGRELRFTEEERFLYEETKTSHKFTIVNLKPEWKIWYKTIGELVQQNDSEFLLEYDGIIRKGVLRTVGDLSIFEIENIGKTKNTIEFISYFKSILAKTQYCIFCKTCVAECPYRNIKMDSNQLFISDNCIRCRACLKISSGCLYYNSIKGSSTMKSLKGINRYLSVGVEADWIKTYLVDQSFDPGNRKTDVMFGMMNDAGITANKKLTDFGRFVQNLDMDEPYTWALLLCNLVYTPSFGWYVKNIPFYEDYIESRLLVDMGEDTTKKDGGKKARSEFWNAFKTILDSNSAFKEIGFGIPEIESKENKNGLVKKTMLSLKRLPWDNPNPEVILYSLYKFAETCGDYYQFTLTRLLDYEVDSDGISPTQIFGFDRDSMEKVLKGLSVNYPDFIDVSFNLGLDNISLNSNKSSKDVLELI